MRSRATRASSEAFAGELERHERGRLATATSTELELSTLAADLPARPAAQRRLGPIFTGLMLVLLLAALDSTIVATALPTIVGDLGGLTKLSWVTSAYLLGQTAVTPLYGKLGDQLGRKRVLQSAVVLFLFGSALCGLSQSITELIAFRAIQGLGAGGLIVLVQASVGDVVTPRERGRYQGLFGAVFGLASVAGPLLGGLIVEHLSWRWIFYVNLPVGLLALSVISVTLPATATGTRSRPTIDYLGAGTLAAALSAIVLVASLGGTTWPWDSTQVVVVSIAAIALLWVFVAVERRAKEPVLPLSLLSNEVFRVAALLSLIVGFALFGSVTFLPLFFQTVFHASPTGAGLRLIPLLGGLVTTSILSGRLITRTGHYRIFPILGTAVMTVGLLLLSRLDVTTKSLTADGYLLVLGLGLGLVMQVLVLAVQNAVDYKVLGAATSGVTLARGIGGSIGAAVFGTIFSSRLRSGLHDVFPGHLGSAGRTWRAPDRRPAAVDPGGRQAALREGVRRRAATRLPGGRRSCGGRLRHQPAAARAPAARHRDDRRGLDDALAAPKSPDSLAEIDRSLGVLAGRERRIAFNEQVAARAGVQIGPGLVWALVRFGSYGIPGTREMAHQLGIPDERIATVEGELRERDLVAGEDGHAKLTPAGVAMADQLRSARREQLHELLADHDAGRDPEVQRLLERLCVELSGVRP